VRDKLVRNWLDPKKSPQVLSSETSARGTPISGCATKMESSHHITQKLIGQFAEVCALDASSLSPETTVDSIGFDSISLALILRAIETEFAMEFSDHDVAEFLGAASIGQYAKILCSALERRQPASQSLETT
jgi:acyl carrier protein